MDVREDALLQVRTFVAGRLSVRAYSAWRNATRARLAELDEPDLAVLLGLVDESITRFTRRDLRGVEALRADLRFVISEADLSHLLAEPWRGGRTAPLHQPAGSPSR